ncbi:hypothetical protein JXA88_06710 [Candidatus Fermentibacteria bacterium]|nr:hypothetical protein [Candidatus Fermentibacteria bacterium]
MAIQNCTSVATAAMMFLSAQAGSPESTVYTTFAGLLEQRDCRQTIEFLRELDDSARAMTSFVQKLTLANDVGAAIIDMPRLGQPTIEFLTELREAADDHDMFPNLAVAAMSWLFSDNIESRRAALRNAPDSDWYAIVASRLCSGIQMAQGHASAIDSALSYLAQPLLSAEGRAWLMWKAGALAVECAMISQEADRDLRLSQAQELLEQARKDAGNAVTRSYATRELARALRRRGRDEASTLLLTELVGNACTPSAVKAYAYRSLALEAARAGEWDRALENYDLMEREDYKRAFGKGFDIEREREALSQNRYPLP